MTGVTLASLVCGLIAVESGGNPRAVSPKGAVGLMQIMPRTAKGYGVGRTELFHPGINKALGTLYLLDLLIRYRGDVHLALTAYNRGPSRAFGPTKYSRLVLKKAVNCSQ